MCSRKAVWVLGAGACTRWVVPLHKVLPDLLNSASCERRSHAGARQHFEGRIVDISRCSRCGGARHDAMICGCGDKIVVASSIGSSCARSVGAQYVFTRDHNIRLDASVVKRRACRMLQKYNRGRRAGTHRDWRSQQRCMPNECCLR